MTSDQLDLFPSEESSPEDSPAKTSLWQAVAQAWLARDQDSFGRSSGSWLSCIPVGSSLRTSLASCHPVGGEAAIWESSSGRWENSGMGGPTECWTLNSSEFPNGVGACSSSLADVLEPPTSPGLHKYFLSRKACEGILRRATRRGKTLPEPLAAALEAVAGPTTQTE